MSLVDDDSDDHFFFKEALSDLQRDIEITTAFYGFEALTKLESQALDYIFLDLNMPLMHGKEFLKTVKAEPKFQEIPVYILSTSTSEKEIVDSLSLGAASFFIKPLKIEQLCNILRFTILADQPIYKPY